MGTIQTETRDPKGEMTRVEQTETREKTRWLGRYRAALEQEQALVIAKTEAEKKVLTAQAEADAIKVQAEAQAEANRLLTASLTDTLVEYQKVQKWDGKLPTVTGGSAILDTRSLTE